MTVRSEPRVSAPADSVDRILASILADIECGGDGNIDEHLRSHPDHADEILALVDIARKVETTRPLPQNAPPERLGDFEIVREMDGGGMGKIYEAIQAPLHRRVAIKTMLAGRISPERKARFLREQQILARLHQTHIVPIHAAGEIEGLQYFAMPYIDGAALNRIIAAASEYRSTKRGESAPSLAQLAGMLSTRRSNAAAASTANTSAVGQKASDGLDRAAASTVDKPASKTESTPEKEIARDAVIKPSSSYLRSVADVLIAAAEAIQHAHDAGILHRDLKPSNIMVDATGNPWIIDFGLAAVIGAAGPSADSTSPPPDDGFDISLTRTASVLGTPAYMAPEQFGGIADVRSDIWALGAILFELLTLRRPFERPGGPNDFKNLRTRINDTLPARPRTLVPNIPADLEAICLKALQKSPDARYQTAQDFAADLRRWQGHEPTTALPARPLRRLLLWSRRNKGWATAILIALSATVVLTAFGVSFEHAKAEAALFQVQRLEREALLQQIQSIRLTKHEEGWSDRVWRLVEHAVKSQPAGTPRDLDLASQATDTLRGIDAHLTKQFSYPANGVAFDRTGKKVLIDGWRGKSGIDRTGAKLWNSVTGELTTSQIVGDGAIAFLADNLPVQLILSKPGKSLLVVDLSRGQTRHRLPIVCNEIKEQTAISLSADGSVAAVSMLVTEGIEKQTGPRTLVFDVATGKLLFERRKSYETLAISPDGAVVAGGDERGQLTLWAAQTGNSLGEFPIDRTRIQSLAFGRHHRKSLISAATTPVTNLMVAIGFEGGLIAIWDVDRKIIIAQCRSTAWDINALCFNPDGTILASAGRDRASLWDVATGSEWLQLGQMNTMAGIAFSPDGRNVAVASIDAWGDKGRVDVWGLENGRGIMSLVGLSSSFAAVLFSPDERLVIGLSPNWELGVWERETGRLLYIFETPRGVSADNASMAFSVDSRRLAFSSGSEAVLWDLVSGKKLSSWSLPFGLQDHLAFCANEQLRLFRFESRSGANEPPFNIMRIRDLLGPQPTRPMAERQDLRHSTWRCCLTPDGDCFLVEGVHIDGIRRVTAFDGNGNRRWTIPTNCTHPTSTVEIDLSGKRTLFRPGNDSRTVIVDSNTGAPLGTTSMNSMDKALQARNHFVFDSQSTLVRKTDQMALFRFDSESNAELWPFDFVPSEKYFATGRRHGTLPVFDLPAIQRKLATVGLGW